MDRKALARCAVIISPLLPAIGGGCNSQQTPPAARGPERPAILAELQRTSPGPWRRLADLNVNSTGALAPASEASVEPAAVPETPAEPALSAPSAAGTLPTSDTHSSANLAPTSDSRSTLKWAEEAASTQPSQDSAGQAPLVDDAAGDSSARHQPASPPALSLNTAREAAISTTPASQSAELAPPQLLPWARSQAVHPEVQTALRRADERVRRGLKLSARGALFAARTEFVAALELVAQAGDSQQGTQFHGRALAAGLTALREAGDFSRPNPLRAEASIEAKISRHRTPLLKEPASELTPVAATERYYGFAQEQLAAAVSGQTTGSMALFGLGKAALVAAGQGVSRLEGAAHARVYFEAAVLADSRNYYAAHELGVLLAESGNLPRARDLLLASAQAADQATTWRNLAVVYERMGDSRLSQEAQTKAAAARRPAQNGAVPSVQWVDASTFAGTTPVGEGLLGPARPATAPAAAPTTVEPAPVTTAKKGINDWLPWSPRR